jgi:hypothetical protein
MNCSHDAQRSKRPAACMQLHLMHMQQPSCKQLARASELLSSHPKCTCRSDGSQPHLVNIQFPKRVELSVSESKKRFGVGSIAWPHACRNAEAADCSACRRALQQRFCGQWAACVLVRSSASAGLHQALRCRQCCFVPCCFCCMCGAVLQEMHLYLDFKSDESYTPSRLAVRAGSTHHDLKVQSASAHAALCSADVQA